MSEVLEQVIENTENHTVEGLEITCETDGNKVEYVGTLAYTRPITFSAAFDLSDAASLDKKAVRASLISSAVYEDDGSSANGYVAMNAKFKKLIKLILQDLSEMTA